MVPSLLRRSTLTCLVLLSGCASSNLAQTELAELCKSETPFEFALNLANSGDRKIAERFGDACKSLLKLDGLDFGQSGSAYVCKTYVYHDRIYARAAQLGQAGETVIRHRDALSRAFGENLKTTYFHAMASEPDDIREPEYNRLERQGLVREINKTMPLGVHTGFVGIKGQFIILANEAGEVERVILTYADYDVAIRKVSSLAGAMKLLELRGFAGILGPKFGQCRATSIERASTGWIAKGIHSQMNCQAEVESDIRIDSSGTYSVTAQRRAGPGGVCDD